MSFQAVTWAIEQKAGSPSAKATLWSIANYANEQWCAWPSQKTICDESEQSPDALQKRLPELEDRGLIRRIPLRFAGRKTVDFVLLRPSRFFSSPLSDIEPLLPRGCSIDPKYAAANSGNAEGQESPTPSPDCTSGAAADSGNGKTPEAAAPLPLTLPRIAAHAAAYERQQEPLMEPKNQEIDRSARAREGLISKKAQQVADDCVTALGFEVEHPPLELSGLAYQISIMLDRGYDPPRIVAAFARFAGHRPIKPLTYFVKVVETACTAQPLAPPSPTEESHEQREGSLAGIRNGFAGRFDGGQGRDLRSTKERRWAQVWDEIDSALGITGSNADRDGPETGQAPARGLPEPGGA